MKLNKLNDKIFLFTADTRKELTLSFFRVQEYYESPLKGLKSQKFNVFDFLLESMDDDGTLNYFSYWSGFNVPGKIVNEWHNKQDIEHQTPYETKMFNQLDEAGIDYSEPYYIIGALTGDTDVIKHEIAHALYETNTEYREKMLSITQELFNSHNDQYILIKTRLLDMGYNEEVVEDEIHAYLSSEKKRYLVKEFGVDYTKLSKLIKEYRKVLLKYNTFAV